MRDPLLAAVGIALLGSVVAGPAVAYGLQLLPQRWRRTTQWLLIDSAAVVAVLADLLSDGPVGGVLVYVLAALPGILAFLAFRTRLASALVSLVPVYVFIGELTRGRPTYAPESPWIGPCRCNPSGYSSTARSGCSCFCRCSSFASRS